MEYLIRKFKSSDIAQLVELCRDHAIFEQAEYNPTGKANLLKSELLSPTPTLYCWVVVVQEALVGYVTYTFDFSTWDARYYLHVDCIFLKENVRYLGIGKNLMQRLVNVAREKGCVNMQWQTPTFNENAIKFYARIGAKGIDKKRFFINTPSE
jgi:GNAT superfamily N-acetyltransferase